MSQAAKFGALIGGLMGALSDGDLATAESWAREFEKDWVKLGVGYKSFYQQSWCRRLSCGRTTLERRKSAPR